MEDIGIGSFREKVLYCWEGVASGGKKCLEGEGKELMVGTNGGS